MSGRRFRFIEKIPILKTLAVCPKASRRNARVELFWTVGFALLAIPVVLVIVVFTRPVEEIPTHLFEVVGRGESMIYAATVCGAALYSLRHSITGPIPDALKHRVTPIGTLSVLTALLLIVALLSYLVQRMGDLNNIALNERVLDGVSGAVLAASLFIAYVILSLKFALSSGAAPASQEQTASFGERWEAERDV